GEPQQEPRPRMELRPVHALNSSRPVAEGEPAARAVASAGRLRLRVIQALEVDVSPETEVMRAAQPVRISDVLILIVAAVVRHVVLRLAVGFVPTDAEPAQAAFIGVWAVRSRNRYAQYLAS